MFIREIRAKMSDISFLCDFYLYFTQNETSAITRISVRVISLMRSVTLNDEDYFAVYDFFCNDFTIQIKNLQIHLITISLHRNHTVI